MEKLFNGVSIMGGIIGGVLAYSLGSFDMLLQALVFMVLFDFITGVIKAIKSKSLSSEIGFMGVLNKIMIFIVVATAVVVERIIGANVPIREIVIMFYIANECISILENGAQFIPIPDTLKDILLQIREENSKKEEEKDE